MIDTSIPDRDNYVWWTTIDTRWSDNDMYGHVNNAIYYNYIDSVVNKYLINEGGLEPTESEQIGVVVESACRYVDSFRYPESIECGLRVVMLGNSSVKYEVGLFQPSDNAPRVWGGFVHVFVDRVSRRPQRIIETMRLAMMKIKKDT